jgi:hypothetical protein
MLSRPARHLGRSRAAAKLRGPRTQGAVSRVLSLEIGGSCRTRRKYQLTRVYRNTFTNERIMIGTGKRGLVRATIFSGSHLVLLPLESLRIMLKHGMTACGRYGLMFQLFMLAGRLRGIFDMGLARIAKRSQRPVRAHLLR